MRAELAVRVTPRASRNKIEAPPEGPLRVWVTASPTDGQANTAVCELVAEALDVAKSRVRIVRGQTSRDKVLHVDGLSEEECRSRLSR